MEVLTKPEPLISIIVPVYNVENYLAQCLESVIVQDYSNIEVILVDDGSTDKSGMICDKWGADNPRINVIHKENGGPSSARNVGIAKARGNFLTFVDADDWIANNYISYLYQILEKNNADVSCARHDVVYSHRDRIKEEAEKTTIFVNEEIISNFLYQNITSSVWCKLFKKELFNNIKFPEGKFFEEIVPLYFVFKKANILVQSEKKIYGYYRRKDSTITKKFSIQKYDYTLNCRELVKYIKKEYPALKNAAYSRLVWADIFVLVNIDNKELPVYFKE